MYVCVYVCVYVYVADALHLNPERRGFPLTNGHQ